MSIRERLQRQERNGYLPSSGLVTPTFLGTPTSKVVRAASNPSLLQVALTTFLALQFLIPAPLVISGLGAAGRPSVVVALGISVLYLANSICRGFVPTGQQPVRWIVTTFVATTLLAYAVGYARGLPDIEAKSSDRYLILFLAISGLALAIADGLPDRHSLDTLLLRLTQFTGVMAAVGVVQSITKTDPTTYIRIPGLQYNTTLVSLGERGNTDLARVAGTANHYIEFGVVLALVMPIAIHYAFQSHSRAQRVRRWSLALLIAAGVPLSISRSAVISLAISLIVLAVVWTWRVRLKALVAIALVIVVFRAVRPGVVGTIFSLFSNANVDPSVQHRIDDYPIAERYFFERPWLGRGLATFLPDRYVLLDNELIFIGITAGIVGLVAFVLIFVGGYLVGRSVRHRGIDDAARHLGQALAGSLISALVASGTFDSMQFPTFVGVVFVCLGAVGALFRLTCSGDADVSSSATSRRPAGSMPPMAKPFITTWNNILETSNMWKQDQRPTGVRPRPIEPSHDPT